MNYVMPAITQSKLQSGLSKDSQKSSSDFNVPCVLDLAKGLMSHDNITFMLSSPPPVHRSVDQLGVRFDNIILDNKLDLLEHLINHGLINLNQLPERHVFINFAAFCHAVANTSDGTKILYSLIGFMKHDISMTG